VAHGPERTIAVSMATMHLMTPTWGVFVHPPGWSTCTQNFKVGEKISFPTLLDFLMHS